MATKSSLPKDFDPEALVSASQSHEQQLKGLSDRISFLESRVGDNDGFNKTFAEAQASGKQIDEAISKVIDMHDKHLLIIKGTSLLKWLSALIIGGIIGTLIAGYFHK